MWHELTYWITVMKTKTKKNKNCSIFNDLMKTKSYFKQHNRAK